MDHINRQMAAALHAYHIIKSDEFFLAARCVRLWADAQGVCSGVDDIFLIYIFYLRDCSVSRFENI